MKVFDLLWKGGQITPFIAKTREVVKGIKEVKPGEAEIKIREIALKEKFPEIARAQENDLDTS